MSNLSQFFGVNKPPKALVNYATSGVAGYVASYGQSTLSGALPAATLKGVLNVSGSGVVNYVAAFVADTTPRTLRVKVVVDGITVADITSGAITIANYGLIAVGAGVAAGGSGTTIDHLTFNTSLVVQIASSLTETDKITTNIMYHTD